MKGMTVTKKIEFQMSALNNKQMWLCDIMTRVPLIKYLDYDEDGIIEGHLLESPITGRALDVWWHVESHPIIHKIYRFLWGSRLCFDKQAKSHLDELIKLGWVTITDD